jgi:nucleotidyltransferase substrate binding protein (TIGR01987 family)
MSAGDRIPAALARLGRAVERLEEALRVPADQPLAIDGTIQRFEFAFELFWKATRLVLARDGVDVATPRETLRAAFKAGWIGDEAAWLAMLEDRNTSSHVYDETTARRIYVNIGRNAPMLRHALAELRRRSAR